MIIDNHYAVLSLHFSPFMGSKAGNMPQRHTFLERGGGGGKGGGYGSEEHGLTLTGKLRSLVL